MWKTFIKGLSCIFLLVPMIAYADESYEATITCPQGSGMSGNRTHYIRAKSDLDAMNQANKILNGDSIYKNRGCFIKEVIKK
jgi:hypothetical protein